jgi:hypothetical protein
MPEAGLEDRLFVGCAARPVAFGKVWSFEVERDTVRRAFAAGFSASFIRGRLEALCGMGLPQSFTFSLAAWEEEYRSLRLYRGYTLVVDERQRAVIERSSALGGFVAETLAPGVYFLSAASAEEAVAALAAAGLEAPPLVQPAGPGGHQVGRPEAAAALDNPGESKIRREIEALREKLTLPASAAPGTDLAPWTDLPPLSALTAAPPTREPALTSAAAPIGAAPGTDLGLGTDLPPAPPAPTAAPARETAAWPDPEPRLAELRACLASSSRGESERRELAERIERRLVLTERQIAQADPHPERLEAGGLDYLGKVRVVERALRTSGDRLEVLYRLPGEEPVRALLRPVKLEKNDKGLVLEAEDLGTGGPVRVSLGAVSTVRRLRASLFGEAQ